MSTRYGATLELRLAETPVPVAAAAGELEQILINAVLHVATMSGTGDRLIIGTSTVINPVLPDLPLRKGRYGSVVISDAASSESLSRSTVPWIAGGLEGRVTTDTDADGRTTITLLLPLMAEL